MDELKTNPLSADADALLEEIVNESATDTVSADITGEEFLLDEIDDLASDDEAKAPSKLSVREMVDKAKAFMDRCELRSMLLVRLIIAYFAVSGATVWSMAKKLIDPVDNFREYIEGTSFGATVLWVAMIFVALSALCWVLPRVMRALEPLLAIGAVLYFDVVSLWRENKLYLTIGVLLVSMVLIGYALSKFRSHRVFDKVPWWGYGAAGLALTAVVTAVVAMATVHRHYVFGTGAHDFGLFVQMFHSLADNLTAVSSCERDTLMSHFDIHASYIFYLLVPFFKLFPFEETLLVAQAVLAMGGVVPLLLIAKKRGFEGVSLFFVGAAYAFCAMLIAPCFYEFHENAFLPTLLMWTLWAVEEKKVVPFFIFSALTCIVKEDAPLFIICIGLYWFFENKDTLYLRLQGLVAACVSGAYMVFITDWLFKHGDGQMMTSSRFGHLLLDAEGGFADVIKNTLADPAYFFSLLVEEDTLSFFLQVMLPLLFLPFLSKKIHRFSLMLPFIITNLVIGANYGYAAQLGYQYIFGPGTLLLYMAVANTAEMTPRLRRNIPVMLASAALIFTTGTLSHRTDYIERYKAEEPSYLMLEAFLDSIPEDTVIGADAFYVPHLADRKEVYIFDFGDLTEDKTALKEPERYDFIVLPISSDVCREAKEAFVKDGYVLYNQLDQRSVIYQRVG